MAYHFNGVAAGDRSGVFVASVGDIDGDGIDDLIIGADQADPNDKASAGETYLVSSQDLYDLDIADGMADGIIELANVAAIGAAKGNSYQFNGIDAGDLSGISVASVADLDDDGKDELIIGVPGAESNGISSGETYLISSRDLAALDIADGGSADGIVDLADVAAADNSYQFNGNDFFGQSGISVASAGDLDGDGREELIVGAFGADGGSGKTYLISSRDLATLDIADGNAADGIIDLADVADAPYSYQFNGIAAGDNSGISVASAGDIDGDNIPDLIIGAYRADPNVVDSGASYLISGAELAALDTADGQTDGIIELANVAAADNSYQFNGAAAGDRSGISVASAGDVVGDEKDDLIISAYWADDGGANSGAIYLISSEDLVDLDDSTENGGTAGDGIIELANVAAAPNSYQFNGIDAGDLSGYSVASVADLDDDGKNELIIGASGAGSNGNRSGEIYLISSKDLAALDMADGQVDGIIDLEHVAAAPHSYQFNGIAAADRSGFSISAADDVTGDDVPDLIIGARFADPNGNDLAGESYLVSGADLALYDASTENGGTENDGIIELANVAPLCFLEGTQISTASGEAAVETLRIGDKVRTADGRLVPVTWIGRKTVYPRFGHDPNLEPVVITAGALGDGLPHTDLFITADHGMILDGLVINGSAMVNDDTIRFVPACELPVKITYYHIETEAHEVVLANGAASETFVDVAGRSNFDNYEEYLDLYGAPRIIPSMKGIRVSCRRLVPPHLRERLGQKHTILDELLAIA
ncbi:MAG: Hint domain-containing protein [Pseudomonadota bacterium]